MRVRMMSAVGALAVTTAFLAPTGVAATNEPATTEPATTEPESGEVDCPSQTEDLETEDVPEGTDVVECGLVGETVSEGDLSVQVPPPGVIAVAEELYLDGAATLTVEVDQEGELTYEEEPEHVTTGSETAGSPSACSDSAFTDQDKEVIGRFQWYLGDGERPGGQTTTQTVNALKLAFDGLSVGYTDCSEPVRWTQERVANLYVGGSTKESDFRIEDGDSVCGDGSTDGRDGDSVIDFGNLDDPGTDRTVAAFCGWYFPQPFNKNNLIEGDTRFNTTDYNFYVYNKPTNCTSRPTTNYDLRAVAVHEFGHLYGLGHVSEAEHGNLTMSTNLSECSAAAQTLGKGDIRGMNDAYAE